MVGYAPYKPKLEPVTSAPLIISLAPSNEKSLQLHNQAWNMVGMQPNYTKQRFPVLFYMLITGSNKYKHSTILWLQVKTHNAGCRTGVYNMHKYTRNQSNDS